MSRRPAAGFSSATAIGLLRRSRRGGTCQRASARSSCSSGPGPSLRSASGPGNNRDRVIGCCGSAPLSPSPAPASLVALRWGRAPPLVGVLSRTDTGGCQRGRLTGELGASGRLWRGASQPHEAARCLDGSGQSDGRASMHGDMRNHPAPAVGAPLNRHARGS